MKAIYYNFLSGFGVLLNVLNTILIWQLFGAGIDADTWFLSLTIIGTLSLIALLGVEQFQYIYIDLKKESNQKADAYAKTVILWAIMWGTFYATLCAWLSPQLIQSFSSGWPKEVQENTLNIFSPMILQIAAAPLLHVTRQLLNAKEHFTLSYLLSIMGTLLLSIALAISLLGFPINFLPKITGLIAILQMLMCLYILQKMLKKSPLSLNPVKEIIELLKKSASMRGAHSMHNFLSTLIISNLLSTYSIGSISVFQYSKRIVDGVSGVAIGIHSDIFYTRIASAWATQNMTRFKSVTTHYLKHTFSLFIIGSCIAFWTFPYILNLIPKESTLAIQAISHTFLIFAVWKGVTLLESVSVGILTINHKGISLFIINTIFIALFWGMIHFNRPCSINGLLTIGIFSQCLSLLLFTSIGVFYLKKHFGGRS